MEEAIYQDCDESSPTLKDAVINWMIYYCGARKVDINIMNANEGFNKDVCSI